MASDLQKYEEIQQVVDFDSDGFIIRRAEPDDTDHVVNLVQVGKDDTYNRVYNYPKVLKLIETAYLAVTVLDREGQVIGFAAFDDYPQGMRGMQDEKHYNLWETWFKNAFKTEEFSALNSLWISHLVVGQQIEQKHQRFVLKKVLHTVYNQLPNLLGVFFLARGDADQDDINYCFDPIQVYFEEMEVANQKAMGSVRGISPQSRVYFSSRLLIIPYLEIRRAQQEDHDDLADVFNTQSETITEAYGEYFLAELIAQQNQHSKALVAQVKDKAVGLMGLTDEVDTSVLHQCFELDHFDNLLKPEYMDAIRRRREFLVWQEQVEAEQKRIEFLKRMKEETMRCNEIAQRIALQEYLEDRAEDIQKEIEDWLADEDKIKTLDRATVEQMFDSWLGEYNLVQPSNFFRDHPTDDPELVCSIQTEKEFMLSTLEFFGLPRGYMEGTGHFPNWEKERKDEKAAAKKRAAKKGKNPKRNPKGRKGGDKEEDVKPTHFDITVFQKCLRRFLICNGEMRSQLRQMLLKDIQQTMKVFLDDQNEQSFKQVVDVFELASLLKKAGFQMDPELQENLGNILLCFGDIEHEPCYGERIPPDTEEDLREKQKLEILRQKFEEQKKEAIENGETIDEEKYRLPEIPPKKPMLMLLRLISITDLKFSAQKMFEYDKVLHSLGVQKFDIGKEMQSMAILTKKLKRKFYDEDEKYELPKEPTQQYSSDPEIQQIASRIEDLTSIPDPPEQYKNAFSVTLFCVEAAFDSRSIDFLRHAFDQFPDRDYLIVTQPHTIVENQLFNNFTLCKKKPNNSFQHVLYVMHRDFLLAQDMQVRRVTQEDLEQTNELISNLDEFKEMQEALYNSAISPSATELGFVATVMDEVVGVFVVSKDVNLDYYLSHFHLQDSMLVSEHDRRAHSRLVYCCVNPIFERATRLMLKELLRLANKSSIYFEVNLKTIIPSIFHEMNHIRNRRFPHFLNRKWDHERFTSEEQQRKIDEDRKNKVDGANRDACDEREAPFALTFSTHRHLSELKIVKNSRIVVVGASDMSISYIEALLSMNFLKFTNIVFVAPGGLPHMHFAEKAENLKACSTSYTSDELRRLMLDSRVRVIDARLVDIDRTDKNIILHDDTVVPYDTLILGLGIQDKTLNCLNYVSRGITTVGDMERSDQILSIDDPHLYQHLREGGTLMNMLTDRKKVKKCVVYGRSLHTYTCIQGLVHRGVKPEQISLAIPAQECHVEEVYDEVELMNEDLPYIYPNAFEDQAIEEKLQDILVRMGVQIIRNAKLIEIVQDDEEGLEAVVFKMLDIPDEVEEEDDLEGIEENSEGQGSMGSGDGGMGEGSMGDEEGEGEAEFVKQKKKRRKNENEVECRLLITAGHKDVDKDVFDSIHNNGLVYNGRLIVDKNFQTTDPSIFAAGSLCEFSGRYKALSQGRSLRMDRYNGREIGARLARCIFDLYDSQVDLDEEEVPQFYLPSGEGGMLPGELVYYHIKTTNPLTLDPKKPLKPNRKALTCDNLDKDTLKGHFIQFHFNNIGLIDSVTYLGSEEVVLQSLWSLVGLHENYLNNLTSRFEQGIIPNVAEFLSENWALALYHEWFGDFCIRMRQNLQSLGDVQKILEKAFEQTKGGEGLTKEAVEKLKEGLSPETARMIQEETLEFLRTNMNHLPMYYIPQQEFQ